MSNSKQLNFFIVPKDWAAINNFLIEKKILFIKVPIRTSEHLFEKNISYKGEESYQVYLTTNDYRDKIILKKQEHGFDIDILRSYCVEFSRGGFFPYSDKILHRARFYATTQYFDDYNHINKKDEHFLFWVDSLYKVFKKIFLKKTPLSTSPFSENALEWVNKNNTVIDESGLKIISH